MTRKAQLKPESISIYCSDDEEGTAKTRVD